MTKVRYRVKESTIERVGRMIVFLVAQCEQETIGDKFDVLLHECGVDSEQGTR